MYKTIFVLVLSLAVCKSEIQELEAQSIFYGVTLIAARSDSNSSGCAAELTRIEDGIRNNERWAMKLLDASGSPKTGFYWGNTYWLGSRKQCLASASNQEVSVNPNTLPITHETQDTISPFPVDYFAAYFYHNSSFQIFVHWDNETKITLGLCLPSSCTEDDVDNYLKEYFNSGVLIQQRMLNMSFQMDGVKKTRLDFSWISHPLSMIFAISTIIITVFVLLGTFYDLWFHQPSLKEETVKLQEVIGNAMNRLPNQLSDVRQRIIENNNEEIDIKNISIRPELPPAESNKPAQKHKLLRILLSFSWYTNFNQIFTTKVTPGTLRPLAGLRFILTCFIIFTHSYFFVMDYYDNRVPIFFITSSYTKQLFFNSSFAVDVFFFMGGFLMVYTLAKSRLLNDEVCHSNWSIFKQFLKGVVKRFRRLTPVYMYILAMTYTNADFKNNLTPFWTNERNDIQCAKYWWTNLLYINNIFPGTYSSMCMSWSYYLANDMQFFIIVSFLFFLSRRYFKTAVIVLAGIFLTSLTLLAVVTYLDNYKPYADAFYSKAPLFYYPPWMRIGPYIIGACFGYMYKKTNGKLEIKKIYTYPLWIASLLLMGYLIFGFGDRNFNMYVGILHTSLSRNLFVLGMGWVIIACLTGHGGMINTALSAKGFLPLSHLTYTAYLMNPVVLVALVTDLEAPWQMEHSNVLLQGMGLITVTYIVSLILVLSVEIPIDKVVNILTDDAPAKFHVDNKLNVLPQAKDNGVS